MRPLERAKVLVKEVLESGDWAVDATLGNGHDCLFLCEGVGVEGKVIGFDVQEAALQSSRERLIAAGVEEGRFELHACGHERMGEFVRRKVKVVMFNLGYLPGADHEVTTKTETSLRALEEAVGLLEKGGLLSVMCYPGHEEGLVESEAVKEWGHEKGAEFFYADNVAEKPRSPFLVVVRK